MEKILLKRKELRRSVPRRSSISWLAGVAFVGLTANTLCAAQTSTEFHRSLTVVSVEPVALSVEIHRGDVDVLYNRDGQVSITAVAQAAGDAKIDDNYLPGTLAIEQSGNHVSIRQISDAADSDEKIKFRFRIDVPYPTEVISKVGEGKQTIRGILGPVDAHADRGDIKVSYVSKKLRADVGTGNLDLQVIGEHVDAKALMGNISGERLPQGISAETGDGDITLAVVGASTATIKKGSGRIDVGGVRGSLIASTDAGDLHVQAAPRDDWKLNSTAGAIRLNLPPSASFELDASTITGELQIEREGLSEPASGLRQTTQQVNGGGKRIEAHTGGGKIVIR